MASKRIATIKRKTQETSIQLKLELDGKGVSDIQTGIPFFDHMLELFTFHGLFNLKVKAKGDIDVDYHHTVEDVGLVLGEALQKALGKKTGIRRYGFFILPMDETLARVTLDISDRPNFVYQVDDNNGRVLDFNIGLFEEFFQAVVNNARITLHMTLEYGKEPHHIAEALFKCFARALDSATQIDPRLKGTLPSTKGLLGSTTNKR